MDLLWSILKLLFIEKIDVTIRITLFIVLSPMVMYAFIKHFLNEKKELLYLKHLNAIMPSWPTTEGTVLESLVKEYYIGSDSCVTLKCFHVIYKYFVDNDEYTSDVYKFFQPAIPEIKSKILAAEYYPGRKISVHYNPENPEECCLVHADCKDVKSEFSLAKRYCLLLVVLGLMLAWFSLSFVWSTLIAITVIVFLFVKSNSVVWEHAVNKLPFLSKSRVS